MFGGRDYAPRLYHLGLVAIYIPTKTEDKLSGSRPAKIRVVLAGLPNPFQYQKVSDHNDEGEKLELRGVSSMLHPLNLSCLKEALSFLHL